MKGKKDDYDGEWYQREPVKPSEDPADRTVYYVNPSGPFRIVPLQRLGVVSCWRDSAEPNDPTRFPAEDLERWWRL